MSQILAKFYNPNIEQELVMNGIMYKHEINGEWFVVEEFEGE